MDEAEFESFRKVQAETFCGENGTKLKQSPEALAEASKICLEISL